MPLFQYAAKQARQQRRDRGDAKRGGGEVEAQALRRSRVSIFLRSVHRFAAHRNLNFRLKNRNRHGTKLEFFCRCLHKNLIHLSIVSVRSTTEESF